MRSALAMVFASVLLVSCGGGGDSGSSSGATTTSPTSQPVTSAPPVTAAGGETFDFCHAGEVFVREYEHADYASHVDPAELKAFMERGSVVTQTLGTEAPLEVQLSMKAVAAAYDKRLSVYDLHGYAIGAVTPEEHTVLSAVQEDVEDSQQRTHDYLVANCNIAL